MSLMSPPSFTTATPSMVTAALQARGSVDPHNGSPPPMMVIPHTKTPGAPFQLPPQIISAAEAAAKAAFGSAMIKEPQAEEPHDSPIETLKRPLPLIPPPPTDERNNDLADVQSMLSMARTGVDNIEKSQDSDDENSGMDEKTLSSHEGICLIEDPIIRDMKLKGNLIYIPLSYFVYCTINFMENNFKIFLRTKN